MIKQNMVMSGKLYLIRTDYTFKPLQHFIFLNQTKTFQTHFLKELQVIHLLKSGQREPE